MRVLLPIIWHELTHCIARAFEEEGHEVHVIDWKKAFHEKRRIEVEGYCISEAMKFQPDLCFAQFQTHGVVSARFPQYLRSIGCFSVEWAGDVRHPLPDHYRLSARSFDVMSFSNWTDVDLIRAQGNRSEFLQVGYDERVFNADGAVERSGVVFLGNNYGGYKFAESEGRREMVKAMSERFGDQFKVYGTAWEGIAKPESIGGFLVERLSAPVLKSALIAVGYDHFHRPGFASDRLLRATACGCAVVNQHYEGIEGEHPRVVAVKSIEEMVEAVRILLERTDVARKLGEENAANTLENHRWNNRVKQVMSWMK
jgi:hypothetical protein